MKRTLVLILFFVCVDYGHAQGTVQFTCLIQGFEQVVGRSTVPVTGYGSFNLSGSLLTYSIQVPNLQNFPAETHFHADGTDLRWSLVSYVSVPTSGNWPGGITFNGSATIPGYQQELLDGHWYVQLHSPQYIGGVIRGYLMPVPEPTTTVMLTAALALLLVKSYPRSAARKRLPRH